jgi:hypothetical protein
MLIPTLEKKDPALSSIYYLTTGGLSGDVNIYASQQTKQPQDDYSPGELLTHISPPDNSGERRFTHQRGCAYER